MERIGAQFVGETDAAPFLAQIEQCAAAGRADQPQGFAQLRPAVAFEAAEDIAGQTFAVQPHQRRLTTEGPDQQRDMLLAGAGIAEGDDLRLLAILDRQAGAGHQSRLRRPHRRHHFVDADHRLRLTLDQPQCGQHAGQPRRGQDRLGLRRAAHRFDGKWADRATIEILARVGECVGGVAVEPGAAPDLHRMPKVAGFAGVTEAERGGALAR